MSRQFKTRTEAFERQVSLIDDSLMSQDESLSISSSARHLGRFLFHEWDIRTGDQPLQVLLRFDSLGRCFEQKAQE